MSDRLKAALEWCISVQAFPVLGENTIAGDPDLARLPAARGNSTRIKTKLLGCVQRS